jgi:hypothetical protein
MKANYPTLAEIMSAMDKVMDIKLDPIRSDIQMLKENMITKADLADLIIDFDHMKSEQYVYDIGLKEINHRVTTWSKK